MESNQKGFTLIELLAVIVILAVIALIATPLVMGVINRARANAAIDSVYGYLDAVEQAVAEYQLDPAGLNFNPAGATFTVDSTNKRVVNYTTSAATGSQTGQITVNYNGSAPESGKFTFDAEGNISTVTGSPIVVNGYSVYVTNGVGSTTAPSTTTPSN